MQTKIHSALFSMNQEVNTSMFTLLSFTFFCYLYHSSKSLSVQHLQFSCVPVVIWRIRSQIQSVDGSEIPWPTTRLDVNTGMFTISTDGFIGLKHQQYHIIIINMSHHESLNHQDFRLWKVDRKTCDTDPVSENDFPSFRNWKTTSWPWTNGWVNGWGHPIQCRRSLVKFLRDLKVRYTQTYIKTPMGMVDDVGKMAKNQDLLWFPDDQIRHCM